MDSRDGIATSGSGMSPFYTHPQGYGSGGSSNAGLPSGMHRSHSAIRQHGDTTPFRHTEGALRPHIDPPIHPHHDSALRQPTDLGSGSAPLPPHMAFSFQTETQSVAPLRSISSKSPAVGSEGEQMKKKRGRPRKYKPDGAVTLGLSPLSASAKPPSSTEFSNALVTVASAGPLAANVSGSGHNSEKRRGRPPGSGKMQQLATLGESFLSSVGTGFTPHVIIIPSGEDIAARIMSSQQGPRAVFILSAYGAVSSATLRQTATSATSATYEGRFEIICLSGSYLLLDDGNTKTRSGGLSICLCSPDGRVIGGNVGGELKAAGSVQVIVGSFMYSGPKAIKHKVKADEGSRNGPETNDHRLEQDGHHLEQNDRHLEQNDHHLELEAPALTSEDHDSNLNASPPSMVGGWSGLRQYDSRPTHIDINSSRE